MWDGTLSPVYPHSASPAHSSSGWERNLTELSCHCGLGRGQKSKVTGVWPHSHTKTLSPDAIPLPMHLWDRTAAPLPRRESTAGIGGGTAGDVITGDVTLHGSWVR